MNICIFSHTFPRFRRDSVAPFMGNLARALGQLNNHIYVLVPFDPEFDFKTSDKFKIITYKYIFPARFHKLGYSRTFKLNRQLTLVTYLIAPLMFVFGFIALLRFVKKFKIDIVSAHWMIPSGFIAYWVKVLTKIPYIVTIPGADVFVGGKNRFFKEMVKIAALGADWVLSDNVHYVNQLNSLGIKPKNVSIVRYGVDTDLFIPANRKTPLLGHLGLKETDHIILAVGRMEEKKGYIYLVKAFRQILEVKPQAKLVFVGDGYERVKLENEVKRLRIEESVIFAGTVSYSRLIDYYNLADVFVMPSIQDKEGNTDASPVAMMEAMSCGVRVVATKFSGSKDFLNGSTGFLVKEKNSSGIADAIINLLSSKEPRSKIQREVRRMVEKNFSLPKVAEKYMEIFKRVA